MNTIKNMIAKLALFVVTDDAITNLVKEHVAKNLQNILQSQVDQIISETLANMPIEILARAITMTSKLDTLQKSRLISIMTAPKLGYAPYFR